MHRSLQGGRYKPNSQCLICTTPFYCPPSRKAIGNGKFCSKKCMGLSKKGKLQNECFAKSHSISKGNTPWNKDKGRITLECPNCGKLNKVLASQSKGYCNMKCKIQKQIIAVSYGAKHNWVKRHYGVPSQCENCGATDSKKFEWANISGSYLLERSDWMRLCCQCHRRYDLGVKNKIYLKAHKEVA